MKRDTYYHGQQGKKYGIYNASAKCFQFGISEDTPMLAEARLYQKIGDDAKKHRFEPRELPKQACESQRTQGKKRLYFRKCGLCAERHEQSEMKRDDSSPNGWICFDCIARLHPEYDIDEW